MNSEPSPVVESRDGLPDPAVVEVTAKMGLAKRNFDKAAEKDKTANNSDAIPQKDKKRKASQTAGDGEVSNAEPKRQKNDENGNTTEREAEKPREKRGNGQKVRITEPGDANEPVEAEGQRGANPGNTQVMDHTNNARYGIINEEQFSSLDLDTEGQVPFTDADFTRARQGHDQQAVECFFRPLTGSAAEINRIAEMRLEYIRPYTVTNDLWGLWPGLSLTMRLNLIAGLEEIENAKAKKTLHVRAAQLRRELERAQVLLRNPRSWEGDEKKRKKGSSGREKKTLTTKPKGKEKGKDDEKEDDDDEEASAGVPPTTKTSSVSIKKPTKPKKTGAEKGSATAKAQNSKIVANWKDWTFSEEKEAELKSLLAEEGRINDDWPKRPETTAQEHYTCEEYRFFYRWMSGKDIIPGTKWTDNSSATHKMAAAFKRFFTDFEFADGSKRSLYRTSRSIMKNLRLNQGGNKPIAAEFKKFFAKKPSAAAHSQSGNEDDEDQQQVDAKGYDPEGTPVDSDAEHDELNQPATEADDKSDEDGNAGKSSGNENESDEDTSDSDSDSDDDGQKRAAKQKKRAERNTEKKRQKEEKKRKDEEEEERWQEENRKDQERRRFLKNGGKVFSKKKTTEEVKVDEEKEEVMDIEPKNINNKESEEGDEDEDEDLVLQYGHAAGGIKSILGTIS